MWLVKEVGKAGGLLCRTEIARDMAIKYFNELGVTSEVVETYSHVLPDPLEC